MDLTRYTGPKAFGRAYEIMLTRDTHAPGSVDRELVASVVRLCDDTADYLYGAFTPLKVPDLKGSRPELESVLASLNDRSDEREEPFAGIVEFTRGLGANAEQNLGRMKVGGTEEEIIQRGSDWCADVARVACVLCQIAGYPSRLAYLFNVDQAYSGHVIIEAFRNERWGALDSSTGVVYTTAEGEPASVWTLMNSPPLIETHRVDARACYTTVGQFRAAGIANYFCWERHKYDYTVSGLNDYYYSILEMSNKGWPGGLRWLHGEDKEETEQAAAQ